MPRRSTHNPTKKAVYVSPSSRGGLVDDNSPASSSSERGKAATKKRQAMDYHSRGPEIPEITPSTPHIAEPGSEFHPLHLKESPRRAYNTLPASIRGLDVVEPIQILRLFLTEKPLETIAQNTKSFVCGIVKRHKSNQIAGRPRQHVTAAEIGRWLGIVIYMGVHCAPVVKNYWKHDGIDARSHCQRLRGANAVFRRRLREGDAYPHLL